MTAIKRDRIDIVPTTESITTILGHIASISEALPELTALQEDERQRLARLGMANETFSLGIIEIARQNPTLIPASIDLVKVGRDVDARTALLPVIVQLRVLTQLLEDTEVLLGVDIYNAALALYKVLLITGDTEGLRELIAEYGKRFAKKKTSTTPADPGTTPAGGGTQA